MQSTMAAGRDPQKQQQHDNVRHRLRVLLLRTDAARLREDQARPLRRGHERAETDQLCALARRNDDRLAKKRNGSVGGSAGMSTGGGVQAMPGVEHGVGDMTMAGHSHAHAAPGVSVHLHMQANGANPVVASASAGALCNGLSCSATMDQGGAAGPSAPLCNPAHMMNASYHCAPLGSSAPAGSFMGMGMGVHGVAGTSASEWHGGAMAGGDVAYGRGMEQYGGGQAMPLQDPTATPGQVDMVMQPPSHMAIGTAGPGLAARDLHHHASAVAMTTSGQNVCGMDMAQHPHHHHHQQHQQQQQQQSFPPGHQPAPLPQISDRLRRVSLTSAGTPTTPNPPVDPTLDGAYHWPMNGRSSSAGDYSQYTGRPLPSSPLSHSGLEQQQQQQQQHSLTAHQQHAQQQQQQQHAGVMPLTPGMDDGFDPVFLDNPQWPVGPRPDGGPSSQMAAMQSMPLSHENAPSASVIPASFPGPGNAPTSYDSHYSGTGATSGYSRQHSASQSSYFQNQAQAQHSRDHGNAGGIMPQGAGTHAYPPSSFPIPATAEHVGAGQGHTPHSLPMAHAMQPGGNPPNSAPYSGSSAFDNFATGSPTVQLPHSQAQQQQQQQQTSLFNFNNTSTLTGRPLPSPGRTYSGSSPGNPGSAVAGFMDGAGVGSRPPVSSMSLQQILQTPSTLPMPERMPYP